jgi:hypothetical protein
LLWVAIIGLISLIPALFVPTLPLIPDILIRSGIVLTLNMGLILALKLSPEWNQLFNLLLQKLHLYGKRKS